MKTFLLEMLAAQTTLLQQPPQSPLRRSILVHLVEVVPAPVLAHFLRLVEHDRYGVAVVRHGVCSGCHLRLSSSQAAALVDSDDFHLCENCSCYLMLAPENQPESMPDERATPAAVPSAPPSSTIAAPRRRKRTCRAVPA